MIVQSLQCKKNPIPLCSLNTLKPFMVALQTENKSNLGYEK